MASDLEEQDEDETEEREYVEDFEESDLSDIEEMDIDEEDEEQLEELIKMGNKQKEKLVIQYEDEAEEPSRLVSHKRPSSSKELDW